MKGFRKWLEDLNRRDDDPDATVAWIDKESPSLSKTDQMVSRHAQNTTPSNRADSTFSDRADAEEKANSLVHRISLLISPPNKKEYQGKPGLDSNLRNRRKDGKTVSSPQGTASYMPPEEAEKMRTLTMEYEADEVETLLNKCADLFIWLERPCKALCKAWIKFREYLHMNEAVQPHVVNYQTNLLRFKDCVTIFPQVDDLVQKCKNSDKHAELIDAWDKFYGGWEQLAPTLKHYLVTFEKNTARR